MIIRHGPWRGGDSRCLWGSKTQIVTQKAIDTGTSTGRLLFGILASLAAFERDVIRERTMAGLAAARARGNVGGRPPVMTPEKLTIARRMLEDGVGQGRRGQDDRR